MTKIPVGRTIGEVFRFAFRSYFSVLSVMWLPMVLITALFVYVLSPAFRSSQRLDAHHGAPCGRLAPDGNASMSDAVDALILDLLASVAGGEKDYVEVMEAWRTSCPRLPVWEEANDRGLVTRAKADGRAIVTITPAGRALLQQCGAAKTTTVRVK